MIIDNLDNIRKYSSIIPQSAIDFLNGLKTLDISKMDVGDTVSGKLDGENYANIDVYSPKPLENCKFEAHKKYIDIQMLLSGEEEIDIVKADGLEISEEYDEKRDIMFFKSSENFDSILLTPFKFVLIYPDEAHQPQVKTRCDKVVKVVVKIRETDI